MVFQHRFPSSISWYEVRFFTTTTTMMMMTPPHFFFISAAAQWTRLAIHKLFRHTFSPLCDTPDIVEGESYSFLFARQRARSRKPCFSWHNFLLTFLLFEATFLIYKFTFRLCFGLACWYFRILQKEKKKNEFCPCFFNYNSIVARDSDVSVLQDFSGIINSVGNIKWRKYN